MPAKKQSGKGVDSKASKPAANQKNGKSAPAKKGK